jgi:hypothetical protein
MKREPLSSTQAGAKAGLSAEAFNKLLYSKNILNKRGRPSKSCPGTFKPYWDLIEKEYGYTTPDNHGGLNVRFYSDKLPDLFKRVGLKGLL